MTARWMTAVEIAAAKLPGLPASESGVIRLAKKQAWRDNTDHARRRAGRGGGWEFEVSMLPKEAVAELRRREAKAEAIATFEASVPAEKNRQNTSVTTTDLTARQRAVMEARMVVLREVDRRQVFDEVSQRQAVLALIDALAKDRKVEPALRVLDPALMTAAETAVEGDKLPSLRTIYLWLKARDEGGATALAPKAKRVQQPLPEWFGLFLKFYARPQKPTIAHALDQMARTLDDASDVPTYRQARTALGKLGAIDRHRGREGALTLKARMAYTVRRTDDLLPTSVYTADGKTFDAEVQHPIHGHAFKPEITSILDVATRLCVGYSIGLAENTFETLNALRHACQKTGIPAIFYADRGKGYKNDRFDNELTGFMGRLGITKMHSLPYNSQARGVIEQYNKYWNDVARELPTYLGRDMDREAAKAVHKRTRADLKLVGSSPLLISWDDALAKIGDAVERYNNRPHSSLPKTRDPETGKPRRMTPLEYWSQHRDTGFEPLTVTTAEADDLFRPYVKRRTRRAQVDWLTNTYFDIGLEAYHGEDVLIGYDIHDAQHVWVREIDVTEDGEERPGRLICKAVFAGNETRYVPLTAERDAIEKRAKARERRLQEKVDRVRAELLPVQLLEQSAQPRMDLRVVDEELPVVVHAQDDPPKTEAGRMKIFRDDAELAAWAIENPDQLSETQRSVLRSCLSSNTDREFLRMSGIDLDRVKQVVRDAA